MNGVLPSLTWGTWDEASWQVDNDIIAEKLTQILEESAKRSKSEKKLLKKGLQKPQSHSVLWFEEVLHRIEETPFGRSQTIYRCNPLACTHRNQQEQQQSVPLAQQVNELQIIPWDQLPQGIHPRDGNLHRLRARNKRLQVENLAFFLQKMLKPGDIVVEFCAGSGYVALPLACLFPACTFVLLDKKEASLAIAKERREIAGLKNVEIFCGFIDEYTKPFDVGIALHACGEATDMVMQKCLLSRASYVLMPCCVGKIKLSELTYPRSATLGEILTRQEYQVLAKAADFGHVVQQETSKVNKRRRKCKTILESDRNMYAKEAQYKVQMFVMYPHDATPKNDILIGIPNEKQDTTTKSLGCQEVLLDPKQIEFALYGQY